MRCGSGVALVCAAAGMLVGCPGDSPKKEASAEASPTPADKTRPGARVRITAGDLNGKTGVVRGRTPNIPHELYDIVLDDDGEVISSSPDRFELVD